MDAHAAERSRLAQRVDTHKECYGQAFYEVASYLLRPWRTSPDGTLPPKVTHFEQWVKETRTYLDKETFQTAFEDMTKGYAECRPSMAEAMERIWDKHDQRGFVYSWDGSYNVYAIKHFVKLVGLAIEDGFVPQGGVADLYTEAEEAIKDEED
jgi:hypothetical protein